jgi:hypothetical protein
MFLKALMKPQKVTQFFREKQECVVKFPSLFLHLETLETSENIFSLTIYKTTLSESIDHIYVEAQ